MSEHHVLHDDTRGSLAWWAWPLNWIERCAVCRQRVAWRQVPGMRVWTGLCAPACRFMHVAYEPPPEEPTEP